MTDDDRKAALYYQHPEYVRYQTGWELMLDAFEGTGGFHDGEYIWPHPREEQEAFRQRQHMARYHNHIEVLIDLYTRFMFTQSVRRTSKSKDYDLWQEDVDGTGTRYDEFLKKYAAVALLNGHAGVLVDKTSDMPTGPTRADERARVIATVFTALDIPDWRHDRSELAAVKLYEAAPEKPITEPVPADDEARQYLLWDREGFARFDHKGDVQSFGTPGLGFVPFVVLRPKPRQTDKLLGRPLCGDANIVRALYNRASEEDEVLRAQAFSVLTVEASDATNVDEIKAALGNVTGTAKALVVKGHIKYETPDQTVPGAIRDNILYLTHELYRAAHMRYQRDSLAAESAEAIRLQYTELNEMLQGLGKALAQAEREIAFCWFAWMNATPEAAQAAYDAAEITIEYPTEFFLDSLINDLKAWAEAITMNLGETMMRRIKKRAVRRIEPELPPDLLAEIDADIDRQTEEDLRGIPPMLAPDQGNDGDELLGQSRRPGAEDADDEDDGDDE